jgi:hypothetical protein
LNDSRPAAPKRPPKKKPPWAPWRTRRVAAVDEAGPQARDPGEAAELEADALKEGVETVCARPRCRCAWGGDDDEPDEGDKHDTEAVCRHGRLRSRYEKHALLNS